MKSRTKSNSKIITIISVSLLSVFLLGASVFAAAAPATASDPLITLSYLDKVFWPKVSTLVTSEVTKLDSKITSLTTLANAQATQREATNVFRLVTTTEAQTVSLAEGNEVIIQSGSVTITEGTVVKLSGSPAAIVTGELAVNNLYMASGNVKLSTSAGAEIWVRSAATNE